MGGETARGPTRLAKIVADPLAWSPWPRLN